MEADRAKERAEKEKQESNTEIKSSGTAVNTENDDGGIQEDEKEVTDDFGNTVRPTAAKEDSSEEEQGQIVTLKVKQTLLCKGWVLLGESG